MVLKKNKIVPAVQQNHPVRIFSGQMLKRIAFVEINKAD
jgi:hypothetical protein